MIEMPFLFRRSQILLWRVIVIDILHLK
jgi:hypothetical protein